ncbi:oligosaccharide flippase family protein [Basfia succiniciproducens]|uniref:Membrane protein involved in the export of O-antigen and teichoic acid n=1 Tax=Basfia succiniciproducens TaxID=653940 RepID=A0A1G5C7J5_9PAST|nr:oligosaccharide flippase family protein [Basfia succiniciproducens]QIM68777.1 RfbX protein [Basfia succiniciproducens]SCX98403.1 Membrane protein involved in the export of O-antigen and teichoic acid [Basfia succiniciproducens]
MVRLISTVFVRQILVGILQVITLIVIARGLGTGQMGQYTLAILLPTLFSQIITFGLQSINIYAIGRKMINENQALYANLIFLSGLSVLTSLILGVVVYYFGQYFFNEMPVNLLYLALASLLPQTFFTVLPSLIQAVQNFKWFNIVCVAQPLVIFVVSMVAILLSDNVSSILTAYVLSHWISFFILLGIILKLIKVETCSLKRFFSDFIGYGLKSHLSNIITLLNYRSSLLILGYFTTPVIVGIYSVGMQLAEKLWLPSQAVSTVLLPRLSNKLGEGGDEKEVAKLTLDSARLTFIVTLIIGIAFACLSSIVVRILFGVEYDKAVYVILLLLPGILAWTPSRILANDLAARGFAELNLKNSYWVFGINTALSLCLVPLWGLIGASVATSIAYSMDLVLRLIAFNQVTQSRAFLHIIPRISDFGTVINFIKGLRNAR